MNNKHLKALLVLLITASSCLSAKAQRDTLWIHGGGFVLSGNIDTNGIFYNRMPKGDTSNVFDTVKVIMLVSDIESKYDLGSVWQQTGYSVNKQEGELYSDNVSPSPDGSLCAIYILPTWHYHWVHQYYLMWDKLPQPSWMYVWQSINVK